MMSYKITYFDDNGKRSSKNISVDSELQLQPYINSMNLDIISVVPAKAGMQKISIALNKPKLNQVIEILENLQVVVKSGLPMNTAITDLAKDADTIFIKDMLLDISYRIQMSMSLSEAMTKYSYIFGETTIGLVKIGEETGQLDETLANAAEYLNRMSSLISKVKSAMITPALTLAAMFGAMAFWMIKVMPQVTSVLIDMNVTLPKVTVLFLAAVDYFKAHFILVSFVVISLFVTYLVLRRKVPAFRYMTDKVVLKAPIFGNIIVLYNYAFISEYTRLMIAAGLPLYQALGILSGSLTNMVFKKGLINARELISDGSSLSRSFASQKLFSPLVIRMIGVGEQTGRLEAQLRYVSNYYFGKVDYISANIAQLIQPFIIVILGFLMIFMLISFLLPIFELVSSMSEM